MCSRSLINLSWAVLLLSVASQSDLAWGHAYPAQTSPEDGVTLKEAPSQVRIQYTEGVELEFSRIVVKSSSGEIVSQGELKRLADDTLAVSLRRLTPGNFVVQWRALSVDTHITEGVLRFTVAPKEK